MRSAPSRVGQVRSLAAVALELEGLPLKPLTPQKQRAISSCFSNPWAISIPPVRPSSSLANRPDSILPKVRPTIHSSCPAHSFLRFPFSRRGGLTTHGTAPIQLDGPSGQSTESLYARWPKSPFQLSPIGESDAFLLRPSSSRSTSASSRALSFRARHANCHRAQNSSRVRHS